MFGSGGAGSGIKIARVPGDGTRPPDHYDVTRTRANALSTRVPKKYSSTRVRVHLSESSSPKSGLEYSISAVINYHNITSS